jgi:signal transduction histidine kinase
VLHPLISSPRSLGGPYLLLWMAPATLLVAAHLVAAPGEWREALVLAVPLCVLYAFVCSGAWYPVQANPPGTPLARLLGVQLAAAATATAVWLAVGRGWAALVSRVLPRTEAVFSDLLPLLAVAGVLLWLLAAAASYLLVVRNTAHQAEREALVAQVAAREAELKALRAQMDPHFLFNSLNSVSALVATDPQGARRMCEQLAAFLRGSLELDRAERIPLAKELALAHAFLQIERVRFGERLRFVSEVDEAAAAVEVPPLLLQPLVENALKHGIAHLVEGGTVTVQAKRRSDTVYLVVENPLDPDRPASPGVALGLENVRRRLRATYGDRALVVVDQRPQRFRVELRIPLAATTAAPAATPQSPAAAPPVVREPGAEPA